MMDINNLTLKLKQRILTDFANKKNSDWKTPDNEFIDFCTHLESGIMQEFIIDKDVIGIIRKIIDKGPGIISDKEWHIFSKCFHDSYYIENCRDCQGEIRWNEMDKAIDEGDYYCVNCRIGNERRK